MKSSLKSEISSRNSDAPAASQDALRGVFYCLAVGIPRGSVKQLYVQKHSQKIGARWAPKMYVHSHMQSIQATAPGKAGGRLLRRLKRCRGKECVDFPWPAAFAAFFCMCNRTDKLLTSSPPGRIFIKPPLHSAYVLTFVCAFVRTYVVTFVSTNNCHYALSFVCANAHTNVITYDSAYSNRP